ILTKFLACLALFFPSMLFGIASELNHSKIQDYYCAEEANFSRNDFIDLLVEEGKRLKLPCQEAKRRPRSKDLMVSGWEDEDYFSVRCTPNGRPIRFARPPISDGAPPSIKGLKVNLKDLCRRFYAIEINRNIFNIPLDKIVPVVGP